MKSKTFSGIMYARAYIVCVERLGFEYNAEIESGARNGGVGAADNNNPCPPLNSSLINKVTHAEMLGKASDLGILQLTSGVKHSLQSLLTLPSFLFLSMSIQILVTISKKLYSKFAEE